MGVKEQSFVMKRGEGLHNKNLITHKVIETPRASSVDSTLRSTPILTNAAAAFDPKTGKPVTTVKTSYVSPMQRARQAKQRREAGDSNRTSKDWDESMPPSSPSASESTISSISMGNGTAAGTPAGTPPSTKPAVRLIPYSRGLIPSSGSLLPPSGHIPKSGYIPKSGAVAGEDTGGGSGRLPKFGVWDNHNNDDNEPCYTVLFENVAQEKRVGGPIRVHPPRPSSPPRSEDLYQFNPSSVKAVRKTRQYHSLLCCFVGS